MPGTRQQVFPLLSVSPRSLPHQPSSGTGTAAWALGLQLSVPPSSLC